MKTRHTVLAASCLASIAFCGSATAQSMPEIKLSGFGTIGAAHANSENADFVGNIFQPSGSGRSESWSFKPDTRLGGQASAVFNDKFSAVIQVISQDQYDNSFTPQVEWANLKYQVTPESSVRVGRIAMPSYLLSESRYVGYSNPWLRPPQEVYSVLAITSNDGVDATWRHAFGGVNNTLQGYYGTSTAKLTEGKVKSQPGWGVNDTVEVGSLTLRAGYNALSLDAVVPSADPLFAGLQQFAAGAASVPLAAFQSAAAQANALSAKYKLDGMKLSAIALGANYDPGEWFAMTEFVDFKGDGFLSDSRSWYVSGGVRVQAFTPYLTYGSTKARIRHEGGISTAGAAPLAAGAAGLVAGINMTLDQFTPTQDTVSIGLRWDVVKNVAIKTQYDRISVGDNSNGRLKSFPPLAADKKVNVVSAAMDFVF